MLIAYTPLRRWMREMAAHVQSSPSASASIRPATPSFAGGPHWTLPAPCPGVGSPAGAIATLRAAATPHWAQRFKGRQKGRFQIPSEASQLLTDWHWPEGGFSRYGQAGGRRLAV